MSELDDKTVAPTFPVDMLPKADAVDAPVEQSPHLLGIPSSMPEGMGGAFFADEESNNQMDLKEVWKQSIDQSALSSLGQYAYDLPAALRELVDKGSADLEPMREELTKDVPLHLHDNIMGSQTVAGAKSRRARVLDDMRVQGNLAQQTGLSRGAVSMAGSMLDADLPLMFASGGTLAAAKTAAKVARASSMLSRSTTLARVAGDTAVGITGGALSGIITGGVDMLARDDADANGLFMNILASAAMGGVLNPAAGTVFRDTNVWTGAARAEYASNLNRMERQLQKDIIDPDSGLNNSSKPVEDNSIDRKVRQPVLILDNPVLVLENPISVPDGSVGAMSTGTSGQVVSTDTLDLKAVGAPDSTVSNSLQYQNWRDDYGYEALKAEDTKNPFVQLLVGGSDFSVKIPFTDKELPLGQIAGTVFTLGQRDFTILAHSKSPTANFMAAEILESASGLVRRGSTSSVLREGYHASAMVHSAGQIVDQRSAFFKRNNLNPTSLESHRQFTRETRLAMDAYYNTGVKPKGFEDLIDSLDKTHKEILGHMRGIDESRSVRGARDIEHRNGYFRYDWEPRNFLRVRQEVGEDAMIAAFRDGYMRASGLDADLADKLGKAIVRRFSDRGLGVGGADSRLLDLDSRSGIEAVLEGSGLAKSEIHSIMRRLDVNTQERAVKGYLRRRTDVDLNTTIEGTNLKLVDLMTDDIERSVQRYVGDAAGSAALAHKGLRDSADISAFKDTMMFEQSALGEAGMKREHLDAVFSQFTGGAHKGHIMGQQTSGVSPAVSMMTKATRASLLQRVGLTQLMDSANLVVSNGLANSMEPIMAKLGFDKVGKMTKTQLESLHGELQSLGVIVGQDHMLFRPHLSIDETELSSNVYMQMGQTALGSIERATNYASGQIHVTQAQQLVASAAVSTNIMRTLAGIDTNLSDRMLRDLGLEPKHISELMGLLDDGTIKVDGGNVELNSAMWDSPELSLEFGAAVLRAVNQQVQKGFIGETSVWMNSDIGKLLSSLKTFSLTAVQKQTARNLMIGGSPHFLRASAWQLGFAYSVLSLGQAVQGTDMGAVDRARLAVAYTPTMGTIPMVVDPITTMLGFDDVNFSPYGRYASYLDTPVFDQTQKLMRAGGSIMDMTTGTGDYDDMQNARAMFFMNWYGMNQVWSEM